MPSPVISVQQMRDWEEASWKAGRSQREVIERVGELIAKRALSMTADEDRVLVLAGKGHNGDDARAAVGHLLKRKVKIVEVADPASAKNEITHLLEKSPRLVIDGIFGIGLNRPLSAGWIDLFEAINAARPNILAIDVPSGLNAETGKPEGAALKATVTLTVGAVKRGLLADTAWEYVGRLELARDIGLLENFAEKQPTYLYWSLEQDFLAFKHPRAVASHKGDFGHVAIFAGSLGYHGAAVLTARGAQSAHPGLITVFTQPETYLPIASQLQGPMVHPWPALVRAEEFCTTLVAGPGLASPSLSPDFKTTIRRYWRTLCQPMIVDASALDWLEPSGPIEPVRVITPHPGEAARLADLPTKEIQADRPGAVRKISARFGNCWVILKGHQTLIGRAKGPIFVNSTGNPFMAQGGTGDVLAGLIGGVLAQLELQKNIELALRFAVWSHGAAADQLSAAQGRWIVEELPPRLSVVGPNP